MTTDMLLAIALAAMPLLAIVGLLRLVDRIHVRRNERVARQIELTDAIHRELGAAAAPTVRRCRGGGWLVQMTVPLGHPVLVSALLRITDGVLASHEGSDRSKIVLTPERAPRAREWSARQRRIQTGAPVIPALR
jgi:hypothetical protein